MKHILILLSLLLPTLSFSQLNCPTFSRGSGFDRFEISPTFNTLDPYSKVGEIDFSPGKYLNGGDYTDKSFAVGVIGKYFLSESIAARLKLVYTKRNVQDTRSLTDSSNNFSLYDEHFDQTLFTAAPGIQWTYFIEHISFYGGFDLPFTFQSDLVQNEHIEQSSPQDSISIITDNTYTIPGGYSAGLGVFAGTTYYFTAHVGVGFETSIAYEYSSLGGEINISSVTTGTPGSSEVMKYDDSITAFRFSPFRALLFATIRF
jgi:hypothetical protein